MILIEKGIGNPYGEPFVGRRVWEGIPSCYEDPNGDWLHHADVLAAVAALEERHRREVDEAGRRARERELDQLRIELRGLNESMRRGDIIEAIIRWAVGKIEDAEPPTEEEPKS